MRHSVLGRGLGQLMEPRSTATTTASGGADTAEKPTGVRIYLSNSGSTAKPDSASMADDSTKPVESPRLTSSRALRLSLFAADALLCLLAWKFVTSANQALNWFGWALAISALALGAWLSVLAVKTAQTARHANSPAPHEIAKPKA